jgi:hypothetical protein
MSAVNFRKLFIAIEHITDEIMEAVSRIDLEKTKLDEGADKVLKMAEYDGYQRGLLAARNAIVNTLQEHIEE